MFYMCYFHVFAIHQDEDTISTVADEQVHSRRTPYIFLCVTQMGGNILQSSNHHTKMCLNHMDLSSQGQEVCTRFVSHLHQEDDRAFLIFCLSCVCKTKGHLVNYHRISYISVDFCSLLCYHHASLTHFVHQ